MLTCTKKYTDIPFAHRASAHSGHCRFIHGHNWSFEFEFVAVERDACGFVVDFGGLKDLKNWLDAYFDHKLVLSDTDPLLPELSAAQSLTGDEVTVVLDCSCEGIAKLVLEKASRIITGLTNGRARVKRVTVQEDSKNSATAVAE